MLWTQDDALAEGAVYVADGAADLDDLWTWWNDADRSDFRAA